MFERLSGLRLYSQFGSPSKGPEASDVQWPSGSHVEENGLGGAVRQILYWRGGSTVRKPNVVQKGYLKLISRHLLTRTIISPLCGHASSAEQLSLSLSLLNIIYIVISCNLLSSPDGDVHIKVRRGEDDPDAQPRVHVDLVRFRARFSSPSHGWVMSGRVDLEIKEGGGDANEQRHHLAGGITG